MAMLEHADAIKSIPGYKIILTAVIKGQIQQLVEQLSYHSDEEFVLLTANVSDGTMTHIGSESGKGFIQDNEDIKSQFLRFCLEDSHMKQITNSSGNTSSLPLYNSEPQTDNSKLLKDQSPKSVSIMQTRTSIGARLKPYGSRRSRKRLLPDSMSSESASNSNNGLTDDVSVVIKNEPAETFSCQESEGNRPVFIKNDSELVDNLSAGLLKNYVPNVVSESQFCDDYAYKVNSDAKVKADDADLLTLPIDLSEMTKSTSKETKSQLCSGINNAFLDCVMDNFDVKQEPKGMLGSDTTSGHSAGKGATSVRVFACDICGKPFPSKWELGRHRRTHTGEKPYKCQFCSKAFADKSNMTQHVKSVHFREPIRKSTNS